MTEPLREPRPPQTTHAPRDPELEAAHRNVRLGLALFAFFLLLFGGSVIVAVVYLALD